MKKRDEKAITSDKKVAKYIHNLCLVLNIPQSIIYFQPALTVRNVIKVALVDAELKGCLEFHIGREKGAHATREGINVILVNPLMIRILNASRVSSPSKAVGAVFSPPLPRRGTSPCLGLPQVTPSPPLKLIKFNSGQAPISEPFQRRASKDWNRPPRTNSRLDLLLAVCFLPALFSLKPISV